MAEKGQTSSITSVTEEEMSAESESDTTESSYSNITSSVLSSTDTDDKLTPGLISISISNVTEEADSASKRRRILPAEAKGARGNESESVVPHRQDSTETVVKNNNGKILSQNGGVQTGIATPVIQFPYGTNPLPLKYARGQGATKGKGGRSHHPGLNHQTSESFHENRSVNDATSKFSTDFSETSSLQMCNDRNNNNELDEEDADESAEGQKQTFLPDFSSTKWYQASCFNRYWSHYRFVMEWYHVHVRAVKALQAQMFGGWGYPQQWHPQQVNERNAKRNRRSRRARRRRRRRSESSSFAARAQDPSLTCKTANHESDDEDIEMNFTNEMLEFFATSYKYKLERDKAEEDETISSAPTERPGVRRTEEMKELYGIGAPMIQGMETAMQMTYDRFLDRFQPSPWPNMPLKITFA
ncbi:unnamed protein product [Candidula unifasciata]|uniref:Gem-associated protein 8 n=1 Tax=Candidula unifasciata TaxID=100452 RepID=A0A8S3Z6L9_9EUPU|nr:unnamed protein product [Candidula unifasciata]